MVSLRGIHVLLVGHDPEALEVLNEMLRYAGAFLTVTSTASETLRAMDRMKPNVLVVVAVHPDAEIAAVIQDIRARPAELGGAVPAIALVPSNAATTANQRLASGYQAHLTMPVHAAALCRAIAGLARPGGCEATSSSE